MILYEKDYPKVEGIEYDLNKRWEDGVAHHPKSEALMERLMEIDFIFGDDFFCWKKGGDGDNGELLMGELDIIFEEEDKRNEQTTK